MPHLVFLILSLVQLTFGIPLLLLFLFWHASFSGWQELLFWSGLVSVVFSVAEGDLWYWLFLVVASVIGVFTIRRYFLVSLTPFTLSLLLFFFLWVTAGIPETLLFYFLFALLFFSAYVFQFQKKENTQRKLF